jgi:hypothetical protein
MKINSENANGIGKHLEEMRRIKDSLASCEGGGYLTTAEAVETCMIKMGEETLLSYPNWIAPRTILNPAARRKVYYWDPRDILDLPRVLRLWNRAVEAGPEAEAEFKRDRIAMLERRDAEDLDGRN